MKKINDRKCLVCRFVSSNVFTKKILNKYKVSYHQCGECGFIQTEKPYWLKEAYSNPIIDSDTGILSRNVILSKITALVALLFTKRNSQVLDYAGGNGLLTRLLRDIGVDSFWSDKYSENIYAKNFIFSKNKQYDIVTAFEFLEHLENPVKDVKKIFEQHRPKLFLFSTTLHDGNPPKDWWYLAPQGGQHISLFTKKSLKRLAQRTGLKLSTNSRNLHILSSHKIPDLFLIGISIFYPILAWILPIFYKSKTFSDHEFISKK